MRDGGCIDINAQGVRRPQHVEVCFGATLFGIYLVPDLGDPCGAVIYVRKEIATALPTGMVNGVLATSKLWVGVLKLSVKVGLRFQSKPTMVVHVGVAPLLKVACYGACLSPRHASEVTPYLSDQAMMTLNVTFPLKGFSLKLGMACVTNESWGGGALSA